MSWDISPGFTLASVLISLGGFANGYDTGSIGAMLSMSQFNHSIGALTPFLLGFTVSLVMLAAVIPSLLSGYLADRFGRLRIILIGAALLGIGSLLDSTALDLPQFIIGRAVAGIGQGVYLGNISVYICEIAPVKYRGTLAAVPQLLTTIGICAGYFTCYGSVAIRSSLAWRCPLIVQCAVAFCVVLSCILVPESPRWLILHGKHAEALRSLRRLRFPITEAESGFLNMEQQPSISEWQQISLIFTKAYRRRTVLGLFVLGMAQLSGIDGVLYVSDPHDLAGPLF
ncbi:hypothetical protein SS1G_09217 [Paecilomyces variotii No. 5]|uniref:Major facilitator superfamily (MFS) profile domain-containing protein n=1 Tax=Byssochlamys spectabilis (strain No. 5 / NBRC 109023) TaxID=1356009 RepID=V5FP32_BYSSN|nr:hypothetical protein SS1G_09217 [Paecilomyces variotii No. 5]